VIAMPLSLIGTFFVICAGYSIQPVDAAGAGAVDRLVVDDAIIVVENVDRHMKTEPPAPWMRR